MPLAVKNVRLPGYAFVHDFAITRDYIVIMLNPITLDFGNYVSGKLSPIHCLEYNPMKRMQVRFRTCAMLLRPQVLRSTSAFLMWTYLTCPCTQVYVIPRQVQSRNTAAHIAEAVFGWSCTNDNAESMYGSAAVNDDAILDFPRVEDGMPLLKPALP